MSEQEIIQEEKVLEQQDRQQSISSSQSPKKKRKMKLHRLIFTYGVFSILYGLYVFFKISQAHGIAWFAFGTIELIVCIFWARKRLIPFFLSIFLILTTVYSFAVILMGISENSKKVDYLIVLGSQLENEQISKTLEYRLDETYDYLLKNPRCIAVLSGGYTSSQTLSEAQAMFNYLTAKGISEDRLLIEDKSTDTKTNIINAKKLISTESSVGVLTSNYHVVRSKIMCQKNGISCIGVGSFSPIMSLLDNVMIEKLKIIYAYIFY